MREYTIGTATELVASLTPACIAEIEAVGTVRSFAPGEPIYRQGESAHSVYLLQAGRVKSVFADRGGNESLLRIHLPDSMLGLTALGSGRIRDATAVALDPVRVTEIDAGTLESMIRQGNELAPALIKLLVDRMSDFHHRVGHFLAQSVDYRLAVALLAISRTDPARPDQPAWREIPLTHEELAQLIGSRRPTVSSVLSRFRQAGLIERQARTIRIADRGGLERLVAELET